MAGITLEKLSTMVQEVLADADFHDYDPAMITDALNWAQEEVAKKTGATYIEQSRYISYGTDDFVRGTFDLDTTVYYIPSAPGMAIVAPGGCVKVVRVIFNGIAP